MADPYSYRETTATAGQTTVPVPFGYLAKAHVHVSVSGVQIDDTLLTWSNAALIELPEALVGDELVRVWRDTPAAQPGTTFGPGAVTSSDLNLLALQQLYVAQETRDLTLAPDTILAAIQELQVDINEDVAAALAAVADLEEGAAEAAANAAAGVVGYVDVDAYNPVGDGVSDDYAALAAAAAAAIAGGLGLSLRAGKSYKINSSLDLTGIRYLNLRGRIIKAPGVSVRIGGFSQNSRSVNWYIEAVHQAVFSIATVDTVPDVILAGCKNGEVHIGEVPWLQLYADSSATAAGEASNAYFTMYGGTLNRLTVKRVGTGWHNAISWYSPRVYKIICEEEGSARLNQWRIYNAAMESILVEIDLKKVSDWRIEARFEDVGSAPGVTLSATCDGVNIEPGYTSYAGYAADIIDVSPATVPVSDAGLNNTVVYRQLQALEPIVLCNIGEHTRLYSDGGTRGTSNQPGVNDNQVKDGALYKQVVGTFRPVYRSGFIKVPATGLIGVFWADGPTTLFRPRIELYDALHAPLASEPTDPEEVIFNAKSWSGNYYLRTADATMPMAYGFHIKGTGQTKYVRLGLWTGGSQPRYFEKAGITVYVPKGRPDLMAEIRDSTPVDFNRLANAPVEPGPWGTGIYDDDASQVWISTRYAETYMTSTGVATDTVINVLSNTNVGNGDIVMVQLADGSTHTTTVVSSTSTSITLTVALPGTAAAGAKVRTGRWIAKTL